MKDKPDKNGSDIKPGDNEDSESSEEQPLDIGEHYLVQRRNETWRKFVLNFTKYDAIVFQIPRKLFKVGIMKQKVIMSITCIMRTLIDGWMNGCRGIG